MKEQKSLLLRMQEDRGSESGQNYWDAQFEIEQLKQNPALHPIVVLGGTLSTEQIAENESRATEFQKKAAAIVVKHGAQERFIAETRKSIGRLQVSIAEDQAWIDLINQTEKDTAAT